MRYLKRVAKVAPSEKVRRPWAYQGNPDGSIRFSKRDSRSRGLDSRNCFLCEGLSCEIAVTGSGLILPESSVKTI